MRDLLGFRLTPRLDDVDVRLACLTLINRSASLSDLRQRVNLLVGEIENGPAEARRAINIALPLVYRLGLDDSRNGLRLGSLIKERACMTLFPDFYHALCSEVDYLYRSYCGIGFRAASAHLDHIMTLVHGAVEGVEENIAVYGRVKSAYSIFEKLLNYSEHRKEPKRYEVAQAAAVASVCAKFATNIERRIEGRKAQCSYAREALEWVLPDLLACSVQFSSGPPGARNFGAAKAKYKRLYQYLVRGVDIDVFFGPAYSRKWHMNRLAFHALFHCSSRVRLPIEVFIRTDYDYFIGYINYWIYKGIDLAESRAPKSERNRADFIRNVKKCESYGDVQEMAFAALASGQLDLF